MTRLLFLFSVCIATGRILLRDKRIPWPIRWVLALTTVCLAIPGPVDEVVILLTLGLVVVFWRQPLREAWVTAKAERHDARLARALGRSGDETALDRAQDIRRFSKLRTRMRGSR